MADVKHKVERAAFGAAIDGILKYVNKDEADREKAFLKLVDLSEKFMGDTFRKESYDAARRMIQDPDSKWMQYVNRILNEVDPHVIKMSALDYGFEAAFCGKKEINEMRVKHQCNIPWLILMDPTSACNLHCTGCWAAEYGNRLNLSFEDMDRIVTQGKELGIYLYFFTGGEPLVRKDDIIRLCEKHDDCGFHAFTNGTLIDEKFCQEMKRVGNFSVAISLEGFDEVNDLRRGKGVFDKVMHAMDLMKQYGLNMSTVAQMLGTVDFTYPAGSVTQGSQDISVATSMEYNTVQKLREMPLMTTKGQVITLQDIANVTTASKDATSISRYNGQDNVSIGIKNKSSAGTVNACKDVKEKLQQIQAENPAIEFEVTYDASSSIISSLTSVAETLLLGVVLTMAVLFLFFGDFKASLIVGASMPISLFLTLILMSMMGFSMNIVTLGSLVIAIGMMVDASIVVIESCFRRQKSTPDLKQAALEGTKEVTASIIASTITTIVVYLPLATMKGLSGQMFEQLGFTIVFAMLASLIAAMMLVPLFYTVFKPKEKENLPIDKLLKKFTTWYQKILRKLMKRRKTVVGVAVALMIGTVLLAGTLDMELIPAADEGVVAVTVNFRSGTTLEKEDEALKLWEQIAEEEPDVEFYSVSISGSSATLTADLIKKRTLTTAQIVDKWNEIAAGMTDMDVTVTSSGSSMSSMMSTSSYEIDLQGNDRAELAQAAEDLQAEIEKIDGVVKTDNSLVNSTTLAKVVVDPLKAMQYGLTPIQVGMTIHNVLSGMNPLTITNDGSEYAVWLEYPEGSYDDLNLLMDLGLDTSFGTVVPLRDIAEINYAQSQETIMKQDGLYQVSVTSTMTSEKIFDAQNAINDLVDHTVFPDSVTPADSMMTGMMNDELQALLQAILVATFLVFLVMAMQFESPRFSFMVMMCIPFALIGSFLLLFITQSTISMVSLMGFLMLMGIVVNNGILFVDSANMLREEGMSTEDALVASGSTRLRPILMTTLTTILSMIPMGLGLGDNGVMMQGMALVIIGGLTASTILTLILIPTFYLIFDKRSRQERRAAKKLAKSQRSGKTGDAENE